MDEVKVLKITVGDQSYPIKVPTAMLEEGESFFAKVDADMDRGWQMSREWVEKPNTVQRCQILADRLLTALQMRNHQMVGLAAAYILSRLPHVCHVDLDTTGDITQTRFETS